ncbi:MAG: hypothetical protein KJ995_04710 [Candidatus Omnitrophica bacterium]|nr:hypothetical protein [Candidatus Omnitrophota bacterium]MBU1127463.1 hypothetical protein [Candidatus Omnitrophota bacterium]MBU1785063.1 hypothetical protein [Candidatus Omnitrophota bacterium]MBU1851687.1 hypothetical protein [Candidatus Omnitrophota bacterium]
MQRVLLTFLCASIFFFNAVASCAVAEYEKLEIKQGMRKSAANEKYGPPLLVEKLRYGFLPIPKEKALYKVDDSTYMILYFFSGRINEITILDDATYEEAVSMFESTDKKR